MTYTVKTFEGFTQGTAGTTGNTGASAIGGVTGGTGPQSTLIFDAGSGVHGFGLLATNVSTGNVSGVVVDFAPSTAQTSLSISVAYSLPASLPSGDSGIMRINTPTTRAILVNMTLTNGLQFLDKANVTTTFLSAANLATLMGTKIRITMTLAGGTTTAGVVQIKVYNAAGTQVGSTFLTTTANLTTETLALVRVGLAGAVTGSIGWDEVQLNDGSTTEISAYTPPANILPVVSVIADQTVSVGSAVTLTSTATDADGTISSRLWAFTQYPDSIIGGPSLSGSTSATASFTPSVSGWYQLQFTATDNSGGTASATTNVFVPGATPKLVQVTANTGPWTVTTAVDELKDGSDSTFIESPNSPTTASIRMRLEPLITPATFSMAVRGKVSAAGTNAETVKLYENGTLRKTWTLPLTTTLGNYTLALTSAEILTITDFNHLYLEFGATLS